MTDWSVKRRFELNLDIGGVVDAGNAEAEEFEEIGVIAVDIGAVCEVFGGDFIPEFEDFFLNFGLHFEVVHSYSALGVEVEVIGGNFREQGNKELPWHVPW